MKRRTLACAGVALALAAVAGSESPARAATTTVQRADWSAGPVTRWTGYERPGGSRRVREVQRRLGRLGYRLGPADGLFGPRTERAALRFQRRNRLRADGIVGRRTLSAIRARDDARLAAREQVRAERPPVAEPAPPPGAPRPQPAPDDPSSTTRGVGWLAALVLVALAAAMSLAGVARRRAHRQIEPRVLPRRELAAQAETSLPPRFTRTATVVPEARRLSAPQRGKD